MAARSATKSTTVLAVQMVLEKETPGAVRYADPTDGSNLPTVYIRKDAFAGGVFPETVTVTVSVG